MKIITLEEHVSDKAIAMASAKGVNEAAPWTSNFVQPDLPYTPSAAVLGDTGAGRIADMDANGIDMQVLSITNATQYIPAPDAIDLAKNANNRMAEAVKANPDRFAAFATLPLADPKAAADELKRTVNELGFKGALISGRPSAEPVFLDDPRYAPVLEAASRLDVPIYTHPGFPYLEVFKAYYDRLDPLVSTRLGTFGWGWHSEVGVQIVHLILSGTFDKYPNLKLIAGHWGEMVPFFLQRLDEGLSKEATKLPRNISEYFKEHIYVTPSGMFTYPQLKFTLEVLGADRLMYSVDYPFLGNENARTFLENAPISQQDKEKIAHVNAERLLKL